MSREDNIQKIVDDLFVKTTIKVDELHTIADYIEKRERQVRRETINQLCKIDNDNCEICEIKGNKE